MAYLKRSNARPEVDELSPGEVRVVHNAFDPYAGEVVVEGHSIGWDEIEEVEVATAARAGGPAGWFVRHIVHGDQRYHVGLYFGHDEAVVPNVTLNVARYIVECVAFYAPQPVRYVGPEGLVPVDEGQ